MRCYEKHTPQHLQSMFDCLAGRQIEELTFLCKNVDSIEITPRQQAKIKHDIDCLKNYSKEDIDLERINGMYCSIYTPAKEGTNEDELNTLFKTMPEKMQSVTTLSADNFCC